MSFHQEAFQLTVENQDLVIVGMLIDEFILPYTLNAKPYMYHPKCFLTLNPSPCFPQGSV